MQENQEVVGGLSAQKGPFGDRSPQPEKETDVTDHRALADALIERIGIPTTPEALRARCVAYSLQDKNYDKAPARLKAIHAEALDAFEKSLCAHEEG